MRKHPNAVKQSKIFNKEQIKKQLLDSFVYDEINKEDLSARVDTVKDCQEAMKIIKEYENIIKTNKKNIICFAYKQGKIFKMFKKDTKFKNLAEQFRINKSTIIFKINIVTLVDKHPKNVDIISDFLKIYYKDIKSICKENPKLLSWMFTLATFELLIKSS